METKFQVGTTSRAPVLPQLAPDGAPAPAKVLPAPAPQAASALHALKLALQLNDAMYAAMRNKGALDSHSWLPTAKVVAGVATAVTVIGSAITAGSLYGSSQNVGPFFLGLFSSAAVTVPTCVVGCLWATKRHRTAVVPEPTARQFVDAYVGGDELARRAVSLSAAQWSARLINRQVAGVFVRRQLKELSDAQLPESPQRDRAAAAIDTIAVCLRGEMGKPLKSLGGDALKKIEHAVQQLDGEDRRAVSSYLVQTLYKNEQPRFKVFDHGASQRLLETLAELQPFQGMSSENLAALGTPDNKD